MNEAKLAFVGFGTVGQGCAKHLQVMKQRLREAYGFEFRVVAITDVLKGSVLNKSGIDLSRALHAVEKGIRLDAAALGGQAGLSSVETIINANADIVIESTWTNLKDAEPGLTHIMTALNNGSDVATSNKGPIALHYRKLTDLAKSKGRILRFESTVMSGTPVFNMKEFCLPGVKILKMRGILNGTTNYILTEMAKGKDYASALKDAQVRGYAETDSSGDVEARDPKAKITILANALMDVDVNYEDVQAEGITKVTPDDIVKAAAHGNKIKLLAQAQTIEDDFIVSVKPTLIEENELLAHVSGVMNALSISTDAQPDITIIGPGAGGDSAGYGLLSDIMAAYSYRYSETGKPADRFANVPAIP